jgi:hypothetical protein
MSSIVVSGDTSGAITLQAPLVAGTNTITIPAATGVMALTSQIPNGLTSGTAVASTSGTSIDFTSIPSWVKRITVMFTGLSTNGSSIPVIQLGTSSGIESSSYAGTAGGSDAVNGNSVSQMSVGFNLNDVQGSGITLAGNIQICLQSASTNTWCANGSLGNTASTTCYWMGGRKALSGALDRVRITTVNGTDTFDAGSINILYE